MAAADVPRARGRRPPHITGSTIQFFSAERYDNIRGFTFDYLVCDEFAFMDEKAWTEVLRATVLVKGKKVLLISTPKGKNHFYQMHQLDGINNQYKSFTMTAANSGAVAEAATVTVTPVTRVFDTLLCGQQALAEAVAEEPHIVIGNVTDKLMRFRPMGWYGVLGFARYREDALYRIESGSSIA